MSLEPTASDKPLSDKPLSDQPLSDQPLITDSVPAYVKALRELGVPYVHPFTAIAQELNHPPIQADSSNPPFAAEGSLVLAPIPTGRSAETKPRRPVLSAHPASEDFRQQVAIAEEVATRLVEHEKLFHIAQSATAKLLDVAGLAGVDVEYAKALRSEFEKMTPRLTAYYYKPLPEQSQD